MKEGEQEVAASYDVVIVGAGISGINTAYRLQTELPELSYVILENRDAIGGTWDLFRYPGIRSDSSLWTFGFPWRPWTEEKGIAEGSLILSYMKASAHENGIDDKIKFNHKLVAANWSSAAQSWTLQVEARGTTRTINAGFFVLCTGYYDYDTPLDSTILGIEHFAGPVVHPQFWPTDGSLDLASKRVVVIGSGATAITLIPALAEACAHVTMLQRSPSYIACSRAVDPLSQKLRRYLPMWLTYRIMRLRSLILNFYFNTYCAWYPERARDLLQRVTTSLLPAHIPHDPHFTPRYNPWEQRLCLSPDGDFFAALRGGRASVVTDHIRTVTATGIELASGDTLPADILVTATGLRLRLGGGADLTVDHAPMHFADHYLWKGAMLQDVPNFALSFGYANSSWTLGADCTAWLIVRLLRHRRRAAWTSATPRLTPAAAAALEPAPMLPLSSTYVRCGARALPMAGSSAPWQPRSSYFWDFWDARLGSIVDSMEFTTVKS